MAALAPKTPTSPKNRAVRLRIPSFVSAVLLGAAALLFAFSAGASTPTQPDPDFIIYTYDSIVAEGGLGPVIFPRFEKICGCRVRALASGDSSEILNRLEIDAGRPAESKDARAQVVFGIDEQGWKRAKPYLEDWSGWVPRGYAEIPGDLKAGPGFLPFDFGVFAFMADEKALAAEGVSAPRSLAELSGPQWKHRLLLEDPRTSGPGLAFLLYTRSAVGDWASYWHGLSSQWLTLAPGWSAAYALFLRGQAPLVWSYVTSQAYHDEHAKDETERKRYRAILFDEGQPVQVEGAAWVKGGLRTPVDRERARKFLEFLLSPDVQDRIALTNWMYPAVRGTKLPASFARLPRVTRKLKLGSDPDVVSRALAEWDRSVH